MSDDGEPKNYKTARAVGSGVDDCFLFDNLDQSPQLVLSSTDITCVSFSRFPPFHRS